MKSIFALVLVFFFCACSCSKEFDRSIDQDFIGDLASENNRIAGDLYFELNNDLSNLTYDYYLTYISKEDDKPSSHGFSRKVKNADYHYFYSNSDEFVIALYYPDERTVLCDNSNTAFLDSVIILKENEVVPDISKIADRLKNR